MGRSDRPMPAVWLAVLASWLIACLDPGTVPCGDRICPGGTSCVAGALCASAEQMVACEAVPQGDLCFVAGIAGRCDRGVCVRAGCGNGFVDPREACDDGNAIGGDGCSADCRKVEACGDRVADEGEQCDDGNANPVDGCDHCVATTWTATAIIGGTPVTAIGLSSPSDIAWDQRGGLYVVEAGKHRVLRIDATGLITTIAGTGSPGNTGEGGLAVHASLNSPSSVAVDGKDNVYIIDTGRIVRVDAAGVLTRIPYYDPLGVVDLAVDGVGNLYLPYGYWSASVVRVDPSSGSWAFAAGTRQAGYSGDGGPATSAEIEYPHGVAFDTAGNLYIASETHVRRVDATTGVITTVAGSGNSGYTGDDGPATEAQFDATGIAFDGLDNMYIADRRNFTVRRVDATTNVITTVAGNGSQGDTGDGGAGASAQLSLPLAITADAAGSVYVLDANFWAYGGLSRVRRVDPTGIIGNFVGNTVPPLVVEGQPPTSASIPASAIAIDQQGVFYFGGGPVVQRLGLGGGITAFAGDGNFGNGGDGGPALAAQFNAVLDLTLDAAGNIYIVDTGNDMVRRVDTAGVITTVAGNGVQGYDGDGGPATNAQLYFPTCVRVDGAGNLYIADSGNHRIRRVDATTGLISTVAGTGTAGFSGDDGDAVSAELNRPSYLALDGTGGVYIADTNNHRVRHVGADGLITTIAGTGEVSFNGDGIPAVTASVRLPASLALNSSGVLFIADTGHGRIRKVDANGIISTVAGNLLWLNSYYEDSLYPGETWGDGGPATSASFTYLGNITLDPSSNVYVSDYGLIRRVDATTGVITTFAGPIDPPGMGPLAQAQLLNPRALVVAEPFSLIAGGATGTLQAVRSSRLEVIAGRYPQAKPTGFLARFRDWNFGGVITGVAYDAATGRIYFSDSPLDKAGRNRLHVVTIVDPGDKDTWTIQSFGGIRGYFDGALSVAEFDRPSGLYMDSTARQLYIADAGNQVIRAVDVSSSIVYAPVRTVIGTRGAPGFAGDGGPASKAKLHDPQAITRCPNGDLFVTDTGNHRVRRVAAGTGMISTVLGDGFAVSSGDGSPSSSFPVKAPLELTCDGFGNLYVTSTTAVRLLTADATGTVDGTGSVQTIYGARAAADRFPERTSKCLSGIAIVDATTVHVTDCGGLLIELRRSPK